MQTAHKADTVSGDRYVIGTQGSTGFIIIHIMEIK